MSLEQIKKDLKIFSSPEKAKKSSRFFKTGPGEYGEADVFIGVTVPEQRQIAKKHLDVSLKDCLKLLSSPIHEYRLTSLLMLVLKYKKASGPDKKRIFNFYIKNTKLINNWDLVDSSAHKIVGEETLRTGDSAILYQLADSRLLWDRRIAIVANWIPITRENKFDDILKLSKILLHDEHDLMHKAIGWMLREVGKKDITVLRSFLDKHHKQMPRTMLRYSIEKLKDKERKKYMLT